MNPTPAGPNLAPEDQTLLERVATRVVELRMEVPAILTLETARPLSLLASQTLYFFQPILGALGIARVDRFARLIERRENVELLVGLIERRADDAHRARREAKVRRRAERRHPRAS